MLNVWSDTAIQTHSFFVRPAAGGSVSPVFAYGALNSPPYSATTDNTYTLSLRGQGFSGGYDDAATTVGTYTANGVLGAGAGVSLFTNLGGMTSSTTGAVYYLQESAAGSNVYSLVFQNFTYTTQGLLTAGSAETLTGSPKTIMTGITNPSAFSYNNTSTSFIYETVTPNTANAATSDVTLQVFDTAGNAVGSKTVVASGLAAGTVFDTSTPAAGGYAFYREDNSTAAAKVVFQNYDGATGALSAKGTFQTDLADLTAVTFRTANSDSTYVFALSGTAAGGGNAVIEFAQTNGTFVLGNKTSVTLAGTAGATRVNALSLPGTSGEVFAYTDPNNSTVHIVQVDQLANIVDNHLIPGLTNFDRIRSFNDGRVEVLWRSTTSTGDVEHVTIYDTHTAGVTLTGADGGGTLIGTPLNDMITGGNGADRISVSYGTDVVNGGDGTDTVVLPFAITSANVAIDSAGKVTLTSAGANDTITQTEVFAFKDLGQDGQFWNYSQAGLQLFADHLPGTITTDGHSAGGEVYALYDGLLGRPADAPGLEYWADQFSKGVSPSVLATGFLSSPEGMARSGAADNGAFVTQLYNATLHRAPDQSGLDYWTGQLNTGAKTRGDVGAGFALSDEHLANIQPVLNQGLFVSDKTAADVARVYYTVLDRAPDAGGLAYWTGVVKSGVSIDAETSYFLDTPEVKNATASLTTAQYVDRVYVNSLGRHAEQDGLNFWVDKIDNQGAGRTSVTTAIGQSSEAQTHHAPEIELGWHVL